MYPRNAASPEPIAIGAVVQISDGAVQMSGCTVRIMPIGVAEGDGGGTTAYSTDGIVYYTPIQAETNYTSFILVAKKTGCIPVAITVVTTSSATPGTVLLAPVTHTSAVVPTVSTLTGHTAQTGDTFALANGAAGFVAIDTVVDAILDDTGTNGVLLSTTALGSIWNRLTSSMTTAGSIGKKLADWVVGTIDTYTGNTPQTGDSYARLGAPAGASVSADIADIPTAAENAVAIEAAILNEGDATALLAAIAAKVEEFLVNEGDATATIAAIATACNAAITAGTVGTNAATAATQSTAAASSAASADGKLTAPRLAKIDGAAQTTTEMVLTSAYDAAKDASSQGSVDALTRCFEVASGTIGTGNNSTLLNLPGLTFGDDELNDLLIVVYDVSEDEYHSNWISAWSAAGENTASLVLTLPFTPQASTDTYVVLSVRSNNKQLTTMQTSVNTIDTNVDTLLSRVSATVVTLWADLVAMITGSGVTPKFTTSALSNAPAGVGGSGTESDLLISTTIDTLTSQTVFTLTAGSADNDAYNRQLVVITDSVTSTQKARGIVEDYVGSTKTVTLVSAPAFTIAAGDSISIIAVGSDVSSTQVLSAVSSAIVSAGITTTVTGMPTFLRVGDARTEANGGAIPVRLYNVDDDSLLFGLGDNLFADATITFSLRRAGTDSAEGTEDAAIPCTWVEDGADGYVQIAYEGDALDNCDAMDRLKEKDCHRWGIKFQWGTSDPITPIYGNISVLRKIVTTQS